jgi:hypothetical protein
MTRFWHESVASIWTRGQMSTPASFHNSLRFLRLTWMFWLASFLVLYADPVIFFDVLDVARFDLSLQNPLHVHTDEAWSWSLSLWLPMALAIVVPRALHGALARRNGSPFLLQRNLANLTHDYRSPPPWLVATSPRMVRRMVTLYCGRLGIAIGISFIPFRVLMQTTFVDNWGCVSWPYVRSVPEHLAFVSMLLGVAAFHVPTTCRVLGKEPPVTLVTPRGHGR